MRQSMEVLIFFLLEFNFMYFLTRGVISKHNISIEGFIPWYVICDKLRNLTAKIIFIPVSWNKPLFGWSKLNTGGSKQDNESIGAGGILRDHRVNVIMPSHKV